MSTFVRRLLAGLALAGLGLLAGRSLGAKRYALFDLTALRNGHLALAVGPLSDSELTAMARLLSPDGRLVELVTANRPAERFQTNADGPSRRERFTPSFEGKGLRVRLNRSNPSLALPDTGREHDSPGSKSASRLVCETAKLPFREGMFDAIALFDCTHLERLISLLKPAGVISLIQTAGPGFRPTAWRKRQLEQAGLEVIDTPGRPFAYVINARRPIYATGAR